MRQLTLFIGIFILSLNFGNAQNSTLIQNKILSQFEHLIPNKTSFASWTMYEGDFNADKKIDYVFSYILSDKNDRQKHAGSGVFIITTDQKNNLKLLGHIPSKTKNIYAFSNFKNKIFYLNEYDAKTNYQSIKSELKFTQKAGKIIQL